MDEALDRYLSDQKVPASAKPVIYEIAAGVIRWKLYLDWVLSHFVRKEPKEDLRYLLWMTLYQVFFMHKAVYHVVDEAVEYVKARNGTDQAGFTNAVLRRSIRERDSLALPADPVARLSIEYSFPLWLAKRWHDRYGLKDAASLLATLNRSPEFGLRVDTGRVTVGEAKQRLFEAGIETRAGRFLDSALRVGKVGPLLSSPLFTSGLVQVQEETSQMAVLALAPEPHELILDACAGWGTKTVQMRQLGGQAHIVAMDIDGEKLRALSAVSIPVQADATRNPFKKGIFDSILLDAPCSSLGIIQKHPEIKWRRKEADIVKHGATQREMVRALLASLKRGGRLVYSVCSFEPEETLDVVAEFVREASLTLDPVSCVPSETPWFVSIPHVTGIDGFFIASFKKP